MHYCRSGKEKYNSSTTAENYLGMLLMGTMKHIDLNARTIQYDNSNKILALFHKSSTMLSILGKRIQMKKQQSHKDIASDNFYCRENLKDINCRKIHYHTENIHAGSSCRFHKQDTLQGDKNFHIFHPPGHLPYKIGIILHQCIPNTDQHITNNPKYHFPSDIDRIHTDNPESILLHTDRNHLHI